MDNNLDNNQGGRRSDKGDPRRDQDPNRNKKNHQSILAFLICLLVTLVCFSLFTNMLQDNSSEITYDKFIDMVNNDEVKSVTLQSDNLTIVPKKQVNPYQEISYYTNLTEDETALTKRLEGTGIIFKSISSFWVCPREASPSIVFPHSTVLLRTDSCMLFCSLSEGAV